MKQSAWRPVSNVMMFLAIFLLQMHCFAVPSSAASVEPEAFLSQELLNAEEWIVGFKSEVPDTFWEETELLQSFPEIRAYTVKPKPDVSVKSWLEKWMSAANVKYIQPNQQLQLQVKPSDDQYDQQSYLQQIGMEKAWESFSSNTSLTIAVVDTGVDLHHPDLKGNLVEGVNLLDPESPPMDDNGHGTNVAGVIAAVGNNQLGTAGILWQANVMPIKALESDGSGDESMLGQGIRYAVEHNAKIVVLSLGLYKYSPFLRDITQYAEDSGVLLVAASGNDGQDVKYPAAYPTVLAVGGVQSNNNVEPSSNYGQEIDITAPYRVYTTALGGDYEYTEGTSVSAPQVAAAAALVWAKFPELKPYEVRNLLKQTAQDVGDSGWDKRTGYGVLRVDKALTEPLKPDFFESNETIKQAKRLRLDSQSTAVVSGGADKDWFYVRGEYKGSVQLKVETEVEDDLNQLQVRVINAAGETVKTFSDVSSEMSFDLTYEMYLEVKAKNSALQKDIVYHITPEFTIYKDAFEDNDRLYKAYSMSANTTTFKGTFHQVNDEDWFVFHVEEPGSMEFKFVPGTYRMDLAVLVQKEGESTQNVIDWGADGEAEYVSLKEVLPGKYYIRVTNVSYAKDTYPVAGEYMAYVEYKRQYVDPNEPNDKIYQSTSLTPGYAYEGVIDPTEDIDYFQFSLKEEQYVTLDLTNIPENRVMSMRVYDQSQNQIHVELSSDQKKQLHFEGILEKGTYYVSLSSNQSFNDQLYHLQLTQEQLVSGLRDIQGHWAELYIKELKEEQLVGGYSDATFRPDEKVTRAEAVVFFSKALNLTQTTVIDFNDLSKDHWAYAAVSSAVKQGIVTGYPDGSFRPNQSITRAEMALMLSRALELDGLNSNTKPFSDVSASHWAASAIRELKTMDWIHGYEDGTYRPNENATRAELSVLIYQMVNGQ